MPEEHIEIANLREVQSSLRKVDPALKKALNAKLKGLAGEIGDKAKGLTPTGPAGGGHVSSSFRPFVKNGASGIRFGGARFPYAAWLEYGGKVGRKKSVSRPFIKQGRYLGQAFLRERAEILHSMDEAMDEALGEAGLK